MSDYTLAVGVLGTANPKQELIDQALTDWIDSIAPEDADVQVHVWLPADRTYTTPGVAAVAEYFSTENDIRRAVASKTLGVRGRAIAESAEQVVEIDGSTLVSELLDQLVNTELGEADRWLILLWEEGTDDGPMEEIATEAAGRGIKVKALSSTGLDDIEFDEEEEAPAEEEAPETEEEDEPEMPRNARTAKISEENSPSPVSEDPQPEIEAPRAAPDEAQTERPLTATEDGITNLAADVIVDFYRMVDAIVAERVTRELDRREAQRQEAQKREEVIAANTAPGKPRAAEDMVTVIRKADGSYARLKPGRLPRGAQKVQISRTEAEELNLLADEAA
ncbi:hypothetical protein [Nonomuraea sp. SYSU D8015]|uniref:hypothetical protein n=1 Tax=Nonomuraea sp. SYSU D8015 TaxID=2593644 RepID=UPI00166165EC|nr:hypothetical protein [Nonomuraea sp. SYSU D8015]